MSDGQRRHMKVGAAQSVSERGQVAVNLERHLRLIELAAQQQVEVLVFPELSLTGYELDLAGELAFSESDSRLEPIRRAAADRGIHVIVGAPVRLDSGLHIGAFILHSDGSAAIYTKQHIGGDEPKFFARGDRDPLLQLRETSAALAVCADTGHASHPAKASARGAGLYLAGVLFCPSEYAEVTPKLQGYAVQHSLTVVLANHGGHSTTLDSTGGSAIWSSDGTRVARLDGLGPGLVMATENADGSWAGEVLRVSDEATES